MAPALQLRAPELEVGVAPPAEPQPPAPEPAVAVSRSRPREVTPLNVDQSRFFLTVSNKFLEKLRATKDALSHSKPGATSADALEACMDLLLKQHAKRRGLVDRPRKRASTSTSAATPTPTSTARPSRYIPADVSREVWLRDEGKCQWPLALGGVCGSTTRVEVHHKDAWGKHHGPPTAERLMLSCAFHNDLAARQDYGHSWMDQFTRSPAWTGPPAA
jgi:5-methylcytosine-specific restriction endonuclease McrA